MSRSRHQPLHSGYDGRNKTSGRLVIASGRPTHRTGVAPVALLEADVGLAVTSERLLSPRAAVTFVDTAGHSVTPRRMGVQNGHTQMQAKQTLQNQQTGRPRAPARRWLYPRDSQGKPNFGTLLETATGHLGDTMVVGVGYVGT